MTNKCAVRTFFTVIVFSGLIVSCSSNNNNTTPAADLSELEYNDTGWNCDTFQTVFHYYKSFEPGTDKVQALADWWMKFFELAKDQQDWNIIVADLWMDNLGRIIGNVQNRDEPVGTERGFRIEIQFAEYADRLYSIEDNDEYNEAYIEMMNESKSLLQQSLNLEQVNARAKRLNNLNPFSIYVSEQYDPQIGRYELSF